MLYAQGNNEEGGGGGHAQACTCGDDRVTRHSAVRDVVQHAAEKPGLLENHT